MKTDLRFDKTTCTNCSRLLHRHISHVTNRETLAEYDDEPMIVLIKYVTCHCGHVNQIDYMGTPLSVWFDKSAGWIAAMPTDDRGTS